MKQLNLYYLGGGGGKVEDVDLLDTNNVGSYAKSGSYQDCFTFVPNTHIYYNQTTTTTSGTDYSTTLATVNDIDVSKHNTLHINVTDYAIQAGSYWIYIKDKYDSETYKSLQITATGQYTIDVSDVSDDKCKISLVANIRRPSGSPNTFRWKIEAFVLKV